jgi:tRNA(fMet)-specific endonuclease VapC
MTYTLDTNILIHAVRETPLFKIINQKYGLTNSRNQVIISAASVGELHSFAMQNKWGTTRMKAVDTLVSTFKAVPITTDPIFVKTYAEIDAYSQGRHPTLMLNNSARNMGKNDLWIATTAAVHEATLLSLDADFNHLDGIFFYFEHIQSIV